MDDGVFGQSRPQVLQLGFLRVARERDAPLAVEEEALLQRRVVEGAAPPQGFLKLAFLCGRRLELVFVGLAHSLRHSLRHGYCSPFRRCSRRTYSCSAHTNSFVKER